MPLGLIPSEAKFFTCLDLKDTFVPQNQLIFAFQWEGSGTGEKGHLTWIQLPQAFKNPPTIFGTALAPKIKGILADQ
jgi:hypothetical protein